MSRLTAPAAWNHEQVGSTPTVEALIRAAHKELATAGIQVPPSRVSRLVRRMHKAERTPALILTELRYYALTYRDVTGETAVRNADAVARHERHDTRIQAEILQSLGGAA